MIGAYERYEVVFCRVPFRENGEPLLIGESEAFFPEIIELVDEAMHGRNGVQIEPGDIGQVAMAVDQEAEFNDLLLERGLQIRYLEVEGIAALIEPFHVTSEFYENGRCDRNGRIGIIERILLHAPAFGDQRSDIEEPEVAGFDEGEAISGRDHVRVIEGGELRLIVGEGRIGRGEPLPPRQTQSHLDPAEMQEVPETCGTTLGQFGHVNRGDEAPGILPVEGTELPVCGRSPAICIRMLAAFAVPARTEFHGTSARAKFNRI